jgi:predicted anti-sigma-YlaC factor YlaD
MFRRRDGHERTVSCTDVREHLSARLDREEPSELPGWMAEHLEDCAACREFDERGAVLTRQLRIHALEAVPDLTARIIGRVGADSNAGAAVAGENRRRVAATPGLTRWALAIVPLGLAVSSLASGAFAEPRIIPSHPVTPCIVSLVRDQHRAP